MGIWRKYEKQTLNMLRIYKYIYIAQRLGGLRQNSSLAGFFLKAKQRGNWEHKNIILYSVRYKRFYARIISIRDSVRISVYT